MTLRDLLAEYPDFFYAQAWYAAEPFLDAEIPSEAPPFSPTHLSHVGMVPPKHLHGLLTAGILARLYLRRPLDPIWARYLWTADVDHLGQRVYVGGVKPGNGRKFEIHRHIHLTAEFGVPTWPA